MRIFFGIPNPFAYPDWRNITQDIWDFTLTLSVCMFLVCIHLYLTCWSIYAFIAYDDKEVYQFSVQVHSKLPYFYEVLNNFAQIFAHISSSFKERHRRFFYDRTNPYGQGGQSPGAWSLGGLKFWKTYVVLLTATL